MIRLIRKDGMEILFNNDMIADISAGRDTVITLTNGEEVMVKNSKWDILEKIRASRVGLGTERREYSKKLKREGER